MSTPAPCTAFRPLQSPADLLRINRYLRYCQTPMGRLEQFLDHLAYQHIRRTALGVPVEVREELRDLTGIK